jgi:predicted RNA methylase
MNKKCQVFTPQDYVEKLLDSVNYRQNLYGKRLLENSCGDGNILTVVVQRYIDDCRKQGFSRTKIRNGLSRDIHGVEIDPEQYKKCLEKLNKILEKNDILPINWKLYNDDYLKMKLCEDDDFDFIVGNPPYITYSELKKADQLFLKKTFESCKKGKFDYCYAFIEKSIQKLSCIGKMAYLIPSSIFKTVFGENLRTILLPNLVTINDYTQEKVFSDALVKSAIIVLSKTVTDEKIHYVDETSQVDRNICRDKLGEKWVFAYENTGNRRFGDYFKVSHAIATLCNRAYVIKEWEFDELGNYLCEGVCVEKEMLRDATSPKLLRSGKTEKIIFPYRYDENHRLMHFGEKQFKKNFPGTYSYLSHFKSELDKRDSDDSAQWFEYGRTQALSGLDCEKALISTIISSEVLVYKIKKDTIPYAGMYIISLTDQYSIDDGIDILMQERFLRYAQSIGIHINGNSIRITSKDIENYRF